jgi:BolA protein
VPPTTRVDRIRDAIQQGLEAAYVRVVDHSAEHVGHPGAATGAGHFEVTVVSKRFEGLSRVNAQRLVYQALHGLMETEIHALSMHTLTPEQWRVREDRE